MTATKSTPTAKQLDYIQTLLGRRDPDNAAEDFLAFVEAVEAGEASRRDASAFIDSLVTAQRQRVRADSKTQHAATVPDVPAGIYALPEDDGTAFYRVDRPTQGRWDGWTFVSLVRADGEKIRPAKGSERGSVLARIAQDPIAASREYGKRTGTCGACSRTLTNPESIALGIGPVCARRF